MFGTVKLGQLDDRITPSQACINPLFVDTTSVKLNSVSDIAYEESSQVHPNLIKSVNVGNSGGISGGIVKAQVSLYDCLACSGCVTSAEVVLVNEQSLSKFVSYLRNSEYTARIVSIAPQSLAAIAIHYGISMQEAMDRCILVLKSFGADYVLDLSITDHISCMETYSQFQTRLNSSSHTNGELRRRSYVLPSIPASSLFHTTELESSLPFIVSSCPGWVCYAEKSFPSALPLMDTTKSSMQIMSSIIKHTFQTEGLFHGAVMMCHDKKLEASRRDFFQADNQCVDMDCVITTSELVQLMDLSDHNCVMSQVVVANEEWLHTINQLQSISSNLSAFSSPQQEPGHLDSGSGGYIEYALRRCLRDQGDLEVREWSFSPMLTANKSKTRKNDDFQQISLYQSGNVDPAIIFVKCYGFQNIQKLLSYLNSELISFDFVEVMACPSGCVNGGGQPKLIGVEKETLKQTRDRISLISTLMNDCKNREMNSEVDEYLKQLHLRLQSLSLLHTEFHSVPKLETILPHAAAW